MPAAVIVSDRFAARLGVHRGERRDLAFPWNNDLAVDIKSYVAVLPPPGVPYDTTRDAVVVLNAGALMGAGDVSTCPAAQAMVDYICRELADDVVDRFVFARAALAKDLALDAIDFGTNGDSERMQDVVYGTVTDAIVADLTAHAARVLPFGRLDRSELQSLALRRYERGIAEALAATVTDEDLADLATFHHVEVVTREALKDAVERWHGLPIGRTREALRALTDPTS